MAEAGWYSDPSGKSGLRYWDGTHWTEHIKDGEAASPGAEQPPTLPPPLTVANERPQPRLIRSPREGEEVAAEWLRWFGFSDARTTGRGADGGVDVRAHAMVAQVKMHMVPVSRPDLQRLYGVAVTEQAVTVFFSLTDYTREAKEWAEQVGMALFRFSSAGEAEPSNSFARSLMQRGEQHLAETQPVVSTVDGLPIGCSDEAAAQALTPRRTGVRRPDRVIWIRQGWLPYVSLSYDYTYLQVKRRAQQQLFAQTHASIELLSANAIATPGASQTLAVAIGHVNLDPQFDPERLRETIQQEWGHLASLRQQAAIQRSQSIIHRYALPSDAVSLKVSLRRTLVLPFFSALISGNDGQRVEVVEAVTGTPHRRMSALFTHYAPNIIEQLQSGRSVG